MSHLHPGMPQLPEERAVNPFPTANRAVQGRALAGAGSTKGEALETQNREPLQVKPMAGNPEAADNAGERTVEYRLVTGK